MTAGRIAIEPLKGELPDPVRDVFGDFVSGLDFFANRIDRASSFLVHSFLDTGPVWQQDGCWTLDQLLARPDGDVIFARIAHGSLTSAYRRFSGGNVLISETLAAAAFRCAAESDKHRREQFPARLLLELYDKAVIQSGPFGAMVDNNGARLSLITVVLWFLAERSPGTDDDDLLDLSCDAAANVDSRIEVLEEKQQLLFDELTKCARLL